MRWHILFLRYGGQLSVMMVWYIINRQIDGLRQAVGEFGDR